MTNKRDPIRLGDHVVTACDRCAASLCDSVPYQFADGTILCEDCGEARLEAEKAAEHYDYMNDPTTGPAAHHETAEGTTMTQAQFDTANARISELFGKLSHTAEESAEYFRLKADVAGALHSQGMVDGKLGDTPDHGAKGGESPRYLADVPGITVGEVAHAWETHPHLSDDEAETLVAGQEVYTQWGPLTVHSVKRAHDGRSTYRGIPAVVVCALGGSYLPKNLSLTPLLASNVPESGRKGGEVYAPSVPSFVRVALETFLASGERTRTRLDFMVAHWANQYGSSVEAILLLQVDAWEEYRRLRPWEFAEAGRKGEEISSDPTTWSESELVEFTMAIADEVYNGDRPDEGTMALYRAAEEELGRRWSGAKGGEASSSIAEAPNEQEGQTLQFWLESLRDMCEVRPVEVTIKGTTYQGCEYWQRAMPPKGSRTEGQEYVIHALYLLADRLPKCYARSSHVCFPRLNDGREWYIAGYSSELIPRKPGKCPDPATFQPFGPAIYLHPWDVPGGEKIDYHEEKPYRRVPLEVRYLVDDDSEVKAKEVLHSDPLNNPGNIGGFHSAGEIHG